MATHEFGTVSFPDRVFGVSSIMPQKRNPVVLEYLKGRSAHMIGSLMSTMTAIKATNFTNTSDGNTEAQRWYHDSLADTVAALEIAGLVLASVTPNKKRMLGLVQENFSTATELADALVREANLSFREAHHVVGAVVRAAMDKGLTASRIDARLVRDVARKIVGKAVSIPAETVSSCLDPVRAVEMHVGIGGPAPREVLRMIKEARRRLDRSVKESESRRASLSAARSLLKKQVSGLARGLPRR